MKSSFKTIIKQFTAILLIHVISTTNHIQAMETYSNPNNCITVVNENNDPSSLLQLNHKKAERSIYSKNVLNIVGMNHLLNAPETLNCSIMRYKKNKSMLQLHDRHSKEENIDIIAYDGDKFIIHTKTDNKIIVTKDGQQIGQLTYQ